MNSIKFKFGTNNYFDVNSLWNDCIIDNLTPYIPRPLYGVT